MKKALIMIALAVMPLLLRGQERPVLAFYADLSLPDELYLGLDYNMAVQWGLTAEFGYNLRFSRSAYAETGRIFRPDKFLLFTADRGPVLKAGLNRSLGSSGYLSLTYFFKMLKADRVIEDPGLSGGSIESAFAEYVMDSNKHGIECSYNWMLKRFTLYAGIGWKHAAVWKDYYLEGLVSDPFPTDRTEFVRENSLILNMGVKYDLVRMPRGH